MTKWSILVALVGLCACSARQGDRTGSGAGDDADAGTDAAPPGMDTGPRDCIPGGRSCQGNAPSHCTEEGRWEAESDPCPELCHPEMGCIADDACGRAAALGSYIGCEYWAAPLPNDPSDHITGEFDFRIVVANTETEAAEVTVRRGGHVVQATTVEPGAAEEVVLPWIVPLSRGITHIGGSTGTPEWASLAVADGAYHVQSSRPVVVYQFNPFHYRSDSSSGGVDRFSYSNDASLLLPVHALGQHHRAVSFHPQSIAHVDERLAEGRTATSYPGYLAVVGTSETPTEVSVVPTAPVAAAPDGRFGATAAGDTLRFTIARGEVVVLVPPPTPPCDESRPGFRRVEPSAVGLEADVFCQERDYDLTGSLVESSEPIVVFGGHTCAFVPYDAWACDHLETQIPPATTLGPELIVTPLIDLEEGAPTHGVTRIVGVLDGTELTITPPIDDVGTLRLDAGEWREFTITASHHVEASAGVMVTTYMVGQLSVATGESERGDPAMLAVPPTEQYRNEYVFVTPRSYDVTPSFPGYPKGQSYATVIRRPDTEVRLDGAPLEGPWTPVGDWEVGTFPVAGGSHRLEAAEVFGLMVYGLGVHTSYAYPGGLDLEPIMLF